MINSAGCYKISNNRNFLNNLSKIISPIDDQNQEISNGYKNNDPSENRLLQLEKMMQFLMAKYCNLEKRLSKFEDFQLSYATQIKHNEFNAEIESTQSVNKVFCPFSPPPSPTLIINHMETKTNMATSNKINSQLKFSSLISLCSDLYELEIEDTKLKNSTSSSSLSFEVFKNERIPYDCCICRRCSNKNSENCSSLLITSSKRSNERGNKNKDDFKDQQRLFNKRVKYEVNKAFGKNYLAEHQVRELDFKKMLKIRKRVAREFLPFSRSIKEAWNNAMNSLRQDRHQLLKKKNEK